MKKILVVLMILAVAGGVFAQQGEWSYAGSVEVGTRMNFNPGTYDPKVGWGSLGTGEFSKWPNDDDQTATVKGWNYNQWDWPRARVNIGYTRGPLNFAFELNSRLNESESQVNFSGDNFKAQGSVTNLLAVFGGSGTTGQGETGVDSWDQPTSPGIKRLWGSYDMFDGVLNLLVAYRSPDEHYWVSDTSGAFMDHIFGQLAPGIYSPYGHDFPGVGGNTFTKVDGHTYIKGNLSFSGIEFGLVIPNIFADGKNVTPKNYSGEAPWGTNTGKNGYGNYYAGGANEGGFRLVDDALLKSIFGVKFNMDPLEFAAQFKLEDYGAYFGGKFNIGLVDIGLSFMGILAPEEEDNRRIKIGGGFTYNADLFGAGIQASLDNQGTSSDYTQVISITPNFFYKVIPSHLAFEVNTGFYMAKLADGSDETNEFFWAVQPALYWNFKGTGASTGYSWGGGGSGRTGMVARYRVVSNMANFMDVIFNWAF